MNDRELAKRLLEVLQYFGPTDWKRDVLIEAAGRLDALRWRSVEEGLPESDRYIETIEFGEVQLRFYYGPLRVTATHWRYAVTPSEEDGGAA